MSSLASVCVRVAVIEMLSLAKVLMLRNLAALGMRKMTGPLVMLLL